MPLMPSDARLGCMRYVIFACLLSGCSAYPVVQWPQGGSSTPALLPQADIIKNAAPLAEAVPSISGRAEDLKTWAGSVTP